jgi:hypothetical protein
MGKQADASDEKAVISHLKRGQALMLKVKAQTHPCSSCSRSLHTYLLQRFFHTHPLFPRSSRKVREFAIHCLAGQLPLHVGVPAILTQPIVSAVQPPHPSATTGHKCGTFDNVRSYLPCCHGIYTIGTPSSQARSRAAVNSSTDGKRYWEPSI